jgi:hypothetical protein
VARILISTPRMFLKLLIVDNSAVRLLVTLGARSAWVKSCRKDCSTAKVLPKPKQQLCIQNGTRAHYLNYLQKWEGEAGKRSAGNRIGYQVIDRQVEDRQTGRNKVDERWYPSRPCNVLNSGLRTLRR